MCLMVLLLMWVMLVDSAVAADVPDTAVVVPSELVLPHIVVVSVVWWPAAAVVAAPDAGMRLRVAECCRPAITSAGGMATGMW